MRLKFHEPSDPSESRALETVRGRIEEFWQALVAGNTPETPLQAIHPALRCDLGPDQTVVVTPETERRLLPLAEAVVAAAPTGWTATTHRAATSIDAALARVREETGLDLARARARAGFQRGHLVDLVLYAERFAGHEDHRALDAAYTFAEAVLGESVLHRWVGSIDVAPQPRGGSLNVVGPGGRSDADTFPAEGLPQALEAAMRAVEDQLPDQPVGRLSNDGAWTLLEANPDGGFDRMLSSTRFPEMLKCHLEGSAFSSERFSRFGERFGTLVVDAAGDADDRLAVRHRLEDVFSLGLGADGAVVGGGFGPTKVYVDVALEGTERAIEPLRAAAATVPEAASATLRFFDSEWADEWVRIGLP